MPHLRCQDPPRHRILWRSAAVHGPGDLPDEPDSSFTETITLTPPTGLDRANYYIRVYMDYAIVIIAVILLTSSGIFVGRKIKNYKKFYK